MISQRQMSFITFILFIIQYWLGYYMGYNTDRQSKSFEYQINLDEDSIHIVTDQHQDTTIHFDELEEWLIRDNL